MAVPIFDPLSALKYLLNLPKPGDRNYAGANGDFERRYGKLREGWGATLVDNAFRRIWDHRDDASGREQLNLVVGSILNQPINNQPTALHLNIVDGWKIEPSPRDSLDALALEFLRSYRNIAPCAGEGCSRLFIKVYSRDKYCSNPCATKARLIAQREWMRNSRAQGNRAKQEAKRRTAPKKAKLK